MCLFNKDGRSNTLPHTSQGSRDFWESRTRLFVPSVPITNSCGLEFPINDLDKSSGLSRIIIVRLQIQQGTVGPQTFWDIKKFMNLIRVRVPFSHQRKYLIEFIFSPPFLVRKCPLCMKKLIVFMEQKCSFITQCSYHCVYQYDVPVTGP